MLDKVWRFGELGIGAVLYILTVFALALSALLAMTACSSCLHSFAHCVLASLRLQIADVDLDRLDFGDNHDQAPPVPAPLVAADFEAGAPTAFPAHVATTGTIATSPSFVHHDED
jgi:hypothetical protein